MCSQSAKPYQFGYQVDDHSNAVNFGHMEKSDGEVTSGHYKVLLPDGRLQMVKYTADDNGYTATVTYEHGPAPAPAPVQVPRYNYYNYQN